MRMDPMKSNSIAAAFFALVMYSIPQPVSAQDAVPADGPLPELLQQLEAAPDSLSAQRLERSIYSQWSKSGSPAADLLLKRGQSAIESQNFEAAIDHLQVATEIAPDFSHAWHMLGVAYFQTEFFGPAMEALEKALALNPDHFGALHGVAVVNELVGNRQLAYQAYKQADTLRPFDSEIEAALERLQAVAQGKKV